MLKTKSDEHVYRAILPGMYKKKNGRISDSAFIDDKGLSVELQCERSDEEVCKDMWLYLKGYIVSIKSNLCADKKIIIHNDNAKNIYHRLLLDEDYKNKATLALSDDQAFYLATNYDKLFEK